MQPDVAWPDVELAITKGLRDALTGVRVVNELPSSLEEDVPLVCVRIAGGGDDHITDAAGVDVEAFAGTRSGMWELAERARTAVLALGGRHTAGVVIDSVITVTRPVPVSYSNPAVRRAIATYVVACRAQAPA